MSLDHLYPITERLRCFYSGRDYSGKMEVTLPTAIMLEAATSIEALTAERDELKEKLDILQTHNLNVNKYNIQLVGTITNLAKERDVLLDDARLMADVLADLVNMSNICDCEVCTVARKYI